MSISSQHYNESIGNYQCKTLRYVPDIVIQKRLNAIANTQQQKMPQQLNSVAFLLFLQVLSDVNKGINSAEEMRQKAFMGEKSNRQVKAHGKDVISSLERITPFTHHFSTQGTFVPHKLTDIAHHILPPCYNLLQGSTGYLYNIMRQGVDFIHRHDPLRFPSAEGAVLPEVMATTPGTPLQDDVNIEKLDFVCIQERDDLLLSDVIRKIADTLELSISEMNKEFTIVSYYEENHACPDAVELANVASINRNIDAVINRLTGLHPSMAPLYFSKNILPRLLRMFANVMDGIKIKVADIESLNDEMLTFARVMIDYALSTHGPEPIIEMNKVPKVVSLVKEGLVINLNAKKWELAYKNDHYYASRNGVSLPVSYVKKTGVWEVSKGEEAVSENVKRDHFFNHCTVRQKRGRHLGTFCGVFDIGTPQRSQTADGHPDSVVPFTPSRPEFTSEQKALISRLDSGLSKSGPNVEKMTFSDSIVVYRVRTNERGLQKFYNVIDMDNKLLPVRAHDIELNQKLSFDKTSHTSLKNIHFLVYDKNNNEITFPIEHVSGHWKFEAATSEFLADDLIALIKPDMYAKHVNSNTLSTANALGIKLDRDGNSYIKVDDNFVMLHYNDDGFFIEPNAHDRLYVGYQKQQYHFYSADIENGKLKLTSEQYFNDQIMNSDKGMNTNKNIKINDGWTLLNCNVKSSTLHMTDRIGSKIDVRFQIKIEKNSRSDFIDLPNLYWGERIKYHEGDISWQENMNAYDRNQNSITFIPWNTRYASAYDFVITNYEHNDNSLVKIYNKDRLSLESTDLPRATTTEQKIQAVKRYLQRNGGILEVTISDLPSLKKGINPKTRERVIYFDIGFTSAGEKISVVKFNQGLSMVDNEPQHVFVTTSEDIELATEPVNSEVPDDVARKRIKRWEQESLFVPLDIDRWEDFS